MSSAELNVSCRVLRDILSQPIPPMARAAAPTLAAAVPVLRELVDGIEDLADRVAMLEGRKGAAGRG